MCGGGGGGRKLLGSSIREVHRAEYITRQSLGRDLTQMYARWYHK